MVEKWLAGEDIPAPPRPSGPPPKLPFHGASDDEIKEWTTKYNKWKDNNSHVPNLQEVDAILERPRPKSDPPQLPMQPNTTDEQREEWAKKYDKWKDENSHLPNLQESKTILERLKQSQQAQQAQQSPNMLNGLETKVQTLEQKLDKLMDHLGVK